MKEVGRYMKNLYIDFDGVIMDTVRVTYEMIEQLQINREDTEEMTNFYVNLNWEELLASTPILCDAFECIDKLYKSNKFDIAILTHVNSLHEAKSKINFIRRYTNDITIIPVPYGVSKTKMCKIDGCILVDDYSVNLKEWKESGGIGIQFSTDLNKNKGFPVINRLDKLINMLEKGVE